jgi:hypothetical protein
MKRKRARETPRTKNKQNDILVRIQDLEKESDQESSEAGYLSPSSDEEEEDSVDKKIPENDILARIEDLENEMMVRENCDRKLQEAMEHNKAGEILDEGDLIILIRSRGEEPRAGTRARQLQRIWNNMKALPVIQKLDKTKEELDELREQLSKIQLGR